MAGNKNLGNLSDQNIELMTPFRSFAVIRVALQSVLYSDLDQIYQRRSSTVLRRSDAEE
jgi:hypothetical protein